MALDKMFARLANGLPLEPDPWLPEPALFSRRPDVAGADIKAAIAAGNVKPVSTNLTEWRRMLR